jgi:diguanylate cyclase (GGDEF)-like protein/PAS domain S-box-containing protein
VHSFDDPADALAWLGRKIDQDGAAASDSGKRLTQVIDTVPAAISAADEDGRLLFVNAYQALIASVDPKAVVGKEVRELLGDEHGARSVALDREVFRNGKTTPRYEEIITDRSGTKRIFLTTKSPLRNHDSVVVGVLTSSIDITEHRYVEDYLLHTAQHDPLTGLPNAALLLQRLRREIALSQDGSRPFALHRIGLDAFKNVNTALGHRIGNQCLMGIASRLFALAKREDVVARLSGDAFVVLQANSTPEDAKQLGERIVATLSQPQAYGGEQVAITGSVGVAMHPRDGTDARDLMMNAELGMQRAKGDGGNQLRFYAANINAQAREVLTLDSRLREAIAQNQFLLHYQPQIDLRSGHVVGAEALVRWQTREDGLLSPGAFLPRAEQTGAIVPINEWVLRDACREAASWPQRGLPPLRIGVNLSPIQFQKQDVPLLVARVLAETGLDPRRLDLELTESILLEQTDRVGRDLQQLRALGVTISIDDFGTRYSSLTYIKHFQVDRLKIDQLFVRDLDSNPNDLAIVRAIISLGHGLDLAVIAEGVETAEQAELLQAEGCNEVQGYFFGRPMPAAAFITMATGPQCLCRIA